MTRQYQILYVDDDPDQRIIGQKLLEKYGDMEVCTADGAEKAQELLLNNRYDALVADYEMPVMNGIDLLRKLRSDGIEIPFIIYTGHGREEVVIEALNHGADYYLERHGVPSKGYAILHKKLLALILHGETKKEKIRNEIRYKRLFEEMADGFAVYSVITDQNGNVEDFRVFSTNSAFEKITGIPSSRMTGRKVSDILPETSQSWIEKFIQVFENNNSIRFETFSPPSSRWFHVMAYIPEKGFLATIIEDITEYKEAQERIERSEKRFHDLYETMAEGVIYFNRDGTVIDANPAARSILDISDSDIHQMHLDDCRYKKIHDNGREYTLEEYPTRIALNKGKRVEGEIMGFFNPDTGECRWVLISAVPEWNEGEETPFRVHTSLVEITEIRRVRSQLQESNAYLKNLIRYASAPIIIWDPDYNIAEFNKACEELTGFSRQRMIGTSVELLFAKESREKFLRISQLSKYGIRLEKELIPILTIGEQKRDILWNSSHIYGENGAIMATIAQGADISDLRRAESERGLALEQVNKNLAELAILNDGIRNPLSIIMTFVEISAPNISDQVADEIKRIDHLVNQLDARWAESEKILRFLKKYHNYNEKWLDSL